MENENYIQQDILTSNRYGNDTEEALAETLNNYQIVELIWCAICIIPNILLLYIFIKNGLYRINFYFILMNWCISDLIYIASILYFLTVTEEFMNITGTEICYYLNTGIPTLGLLIVTPFMFGGFLKSENFCKYFIFINWFVLILYTIAVIVLCYYDYYFVEKLLYVTGYVKILCVVTLVVKILIFFIKERDDDNTGLRIIMAGVYILLNLYVWFFELMSVLEYVTMDFFEFVLFASYADGYINLALLLYFNTSMKCYFSQLFQTYDEKIIIDCPERI